MRWLAAELSRVRRPLALRPHLAMGLPFQCWFIRCAGCIGVPWWRLESDDKPMDGCRTQEQLVGAKFRPCGWTRIDTRDYRLESPFPGNWLIRSSVLTICSPR